MANAKEGGAGRVVATLIVTIVVLLPILYLVSAGPMEWLMSRGYIAYDNPYVDAFYYPGELLMENPLDWLKLRTAHDTADIE